jgi:hypothetical protein
MEIFWCRVLGIMHVKEIIQNLKYLNFQAKTEMEGSLGLKYAQIGVMLIHLVTIFIVFLYWKSDLL